jgi:hypothetical protein
VVLNDPTLVGAVSDSRLSLGFSGGGQNRYIVFKNVRGTVDMFAVSLGVQTRSDGGGDYIAIGLPGYVRYTNLGFESLSVQNDPTAPVTNSLGSLNINGTVSLQGQVRFASWGHLIAFRSRRCTARSAGRPGRSTARRSSHAPQTSSRPATNRSRRP